MLSPHYICHVFYFIQNLSDSFADIIDKHKYFSHISTTNKHIMVTFKEPRIFIVETVVKVSIPLKFLQLL